MYCPACNKDFSPVHSRCPECKGWLRVSGPIATPEQTPAASSIDAASTLKMQALKATNRPHPGLQTATERVETITRGGLASGWESTASFSAPIASPAATRQPTGWSAPAASNSNIPGPAPNWGTPSNQWGSNNTPTPGSAQNSGLIAPSPKTNGWLGDGSENSHSHNYSTSPPRPGGWLGEASEAPAIAPKPAATPVSLPALNLSDDNQLELPDQTVPVDLGTPWQEQNPKGIPNRIIYLILAGLITSLLVFSTYLYWRQKHLQKPPMIAQTVAPGSREVGLENLLKAQNAFKAGKYAEAQSLAQTAFLLIGELEAATEQERRNVKSFYRQATLRYAFSLMEQAQRTQKDVVQATGLTEQAYRMFNNIPDTNKEQSQALALQGNIYLRAGDTASAMLAYSKANRLQPGRYANEIQKARQLGAPAPSPDPSSQDQTPPPEEHPQTDSSSQIYPERRMRGNYQPRNNPPPPPAQPVNAKPRPRPTSTYVPPKKDDRPSWRKRPSDVLPTY